MRRHLNGGCGVCRRETVLECVCTDFDALHHPVHALVCPRRVGTVGVSNGVTDVAVASWGDIAVGGVEAGGVFVWALRLFQICLWVGVWRIPVLTHRLLEHGRDPAVAQVALRVRLPREVLHSTMPASSIVRAPATATRGGTSAHEDARANRLPYLVRRTRAGGRSAVTCRREVRGGPRDCGSFPTALPPLSACTVRTVAPVSAAGGSHRAAPGSLTDPGRALVGCPRQPYRAPGHAARGALCARATSAAAARWGGGQRAPPDTRALPCLRRSGWARAVALDSVQQRPVPMHDDSALPIAVCGCAEPGSAVPSAQNESAHRSKKNCTEF